MDPFSSLDAFLNDSYESTTSAVIPIDDEIENTSINVSLDLEEPKTKKKSNKSAGKSDDAGSTLKVNKRTTFVPGRGQKTAYNKLKKIKDSIAVPKEVEAVKSKAKNKATQSARQKRAVQRRHRTYDSSDEDTFESNRRPSPRATMPAFVNLDSDDEYAQTPISIKRNLASVSTGLQTSENDEMRVDVKFGTKLDIYMLRPFQKLSELIAKVAERKSIDAETIFLMLNGKIVAPSSSLRSIDYIPGLVICAHVANQNATATRSNITTSKKPENSDEIELRIQTALRKQPFAVHIGKLEKLSCLVFQCAEEFKCDPKKIRLEFDGEQLDTNKRAEDHELEGGEMIDMFISTS